MGEKMKNIKTVIITMAIALTGAGSIATAKSSTLNTAKIEELTHLKGTLDVKDGVFKVSYPRSDLHVVANGVKITPAMGLTAWAAFKKVHGHTMVMGDIVMTEGQVNYVLSAALHNGLDVTALHNHFLGENPRVMFMHIGGMGTEEKLASAVGAVFSALKESTAYKLPEASIDPAHSHLNIKALDQAMNASGSLGAGVYKFTFGRTTKMNGQTVGNAMGINTWAAFTGTPDKAVVDGDFVMHESELQNVLKTLRSHDINIVSIHNHMINESPRCIFLHFWGIGNSVDLAKSIRAALDTQSKR